MSPLIYVDPPPIIHTCTTSIVTGESACTCTSAPRPKPPPPLSRRELKRRRRTTQTGIPGMQKSKILYGRNA